MELIPSAVKQVDVHSPSLSPEAGRTIWLGLALLLLAWNGLAASYTSPFHILHANDTAQYHLLVRNRLQGHFEVGDDAHSVRSEGLHPVWRPGLVWVEELLARRLGSVALSAAVASAFGVMLLEWLLLRLTVMCFGWVAGGAALIFLLAPLPSANCYLAAAVGMAAEPWAGAAILAGFVVLVAALRRHSWAGVVLAGCLAGLAEWFRAGNHLLFAVPCAIYGLVALGRRDWRGFFQPATAGAAFLVILAAGSRLVPSQVDKTTMNLWHRQMEFHGPKIYGIGGGLITLYLGGLCIFDDSNQECYDYAVPNSRNVPALSYFREHQGDIIGIYKHGLREIVTQGASGLRYMLGNVLAVCFVIQMLGSLWIRQESSLHSLALGGGALAHYLIPTALLRGDEPTHYLYVALSLFVVVAAGGAARILQLVRLAVTSWRPGWTAGLAAARGFILVLVVAPLVCLALVYYHGAIQLLREDQLQAQAEQAALDALPLEGKRVCCRNMNWFTDRNVLTVFFPYATVEQFQKYARAQQIDGLLLWEHERQPMFSATPYESLDRFEETLQRSSVFGSPVISGAWRWYPVKQTSEKNPTLVH